MVPTAETPPTPHPLLERLGLHRRELRAWALYDWGISAAQTVIFASVFQIFFVTYAAHGLGKTEGQQWWGYANVLGAVFVALLAPVLGAIADVRASKKQFLGAFTILGVGATAAMSTIGQGDILLATVLLVVTLVAATGSMTFYESLLPHIARGHEVDRVSTAGYALGYVGGGILLALNLLLIQFPAAFGLPAGEGLTAAQASLPARLGFVSVGLWWLLFSIPLFRRVAEPAQLLETDEHRGAAPWRVALTRLGETLRALRTYQQAFLMMLAFMIYNEGIQTVIRMGAMFGEDLGFSQGALMGAILLVQFIGVPCAFAFGLIAGRVGAKRAVFAGLAVYVGICVFAYRMQTVQQFYLLAVLVGLVQGGTQALSRSLFASMIPRHKSGEFFGFFSVFAKFGGIAGPLVFTLMLGETESTRTAMLSVIVFFVAGILVLTRVDVAAGVRAAEAADADLRPG